MAFVLEPAGRVIAEIEFDSHEAMADFTPPDWFGLEVTEDHNYSNASLALRAPDEPSTPAPAD